MKIEEYEIKELENLITLGKLKDNLDSDDLLLIKVYTDKQLEKN